MTINTFKAEEQITRTFDLKFDEDDPLHAVVDDEDNLIAITAGRGPAVELVEVDSFNQKHFRVVKITR